MKGRIFYRCKLAAGIALCTASLQLHAGAYVFAGDANGLDLVTHARNYNGTGGVVQNMVCIVPGSTQAADLEIPVQNTIDRFNQFVAIVGNLQTGANNDIPAGAVDIESALLHEVGHCIGLAHPNLASESGLSGADTNYTKTERGANGNFDLGLGPDGVRGSADDVRGDDSNLHWFLTDSNNPFIAPVEAVDSSNFSRNIADLPAGDSFAVNGDRGVAPLLSLPPTEAVMQQGQGTDEDQRALTGDEVNTLRFARTGLDHVDGTADDYMVNLVYGGISADPGCAITVALDTSTGFAVCRLNGAGIGGNNVAITGADVRYNENANWFFTNTRIPSPVTDTLTVLIGDTATTLDGGSTSLLANDTHPNGSPLTLTAQTFGGPSNGNVTLNANGTFSYTHDGGASESDRFVYQVCVDDGGATNTCSYGLVNITVDTFDPDLVFRSGFEN